MKTKGLGTEVGLQLINLIIPLHATYTRHLQGPCRKLSRHLLKQIQRFARLLHQKDCQSTATVNIFKVLPQHKDC